MWAITSTDALGYFEDTDSFVSVFLTDRYETDVVRNLAEGFNAYNEQLGHRWHLLMPYKGETYQLNEVLHQVAVRPDNFNEDLAIEIADFFEIKSDKFPCIVFIFGEEYLTVSVPNIGKDLRLFFTCLSQEIDKFWFENNPDSSSRKMYMADAIKKLQLKGMLAYTIDVARKPSTYLKLIPSIIKIANGLKP